jgi:hypothetical protein
MAERGELSDDGAVLERELADLRSSFVGDDYKRLVDHDGRQLRTFEQRIGDMRWLPPEGRAAVDPVGTVVAMPMYSVRQLRTVSGLPSCAWSRAVAFVAAELREDRPTDVARWWRAHGRPRLEAWRGDFRPSTPFERAIEAGALELARISSEGPSGFDCGPTTAWPADWVVEP